MVSAVCDALMTLGPSTATAPSHAIPIVQRMVASSNARRRLTLHRSLTVRAAVGLLSASITMGMSYAARPMLTDDARVVDTGGCQIETWVQRSATTPERWVLPACSGGPGTEWTVGGQWLDQQRPAANATLLVQHKRIQKAPSAQDWGWAMTLGATVSSGSAHAPSQRSGYLNLPMTYVSADEKTLLHLNLGALTQDQAQSTAARVPGRVQFTGGVAIEHQWAARWWGIAESSWPGRNRQQLQLGVRYWLVPEQLQVDTTLGRSQQGASFGSVGLRWLFAAP